MFIKYVEIVIETYFEILYNYIGIFYTGDKERQTSKNSLKPAKKSLKHTREKAP